MGVDYASPSPLPGGGNHGDQSESQRCVDDRDRRSGGGAAEKLEALAKAGADLEVVFARRTPEHTGQGILFAGPIEGAKVTRAAQEAGFKRSENIHGVRIEGTDKPGLGAKIARALAESRRQHPRPEQHGDRQELPELLRRWTAPRMQRGS